MAEDIVPGLLQNINQQFDVKTANSAKLKNALKLLEDKKATYVDVNDYAVEVGNILSEVFGANISADVLPDGKMYFNVADRILNETLQKNYDLITGYASNVQTQLNHNAGIRLKAQVPELNHDRIEGIVNRVSSEDDFEQIQWLLDEPIVTFSQSIVDDTIEKNVEFQAKAGLTPKITRTVVGRACAWCKSLAGSFDYFNKPDDIYRRHERCRCTVEYDPGNNKKQNVWSKKWQDPKKDAKIEARKSIGLLTQYDTSHYAHNSDGTFKVSRTVHNKVPSDCLPFEVVDVVTSKGNINRTLINGNGNRGMRIDSSDHGQPKYHPMGAHKHVIQYDESGKYITDGKAMILKPKDRKENNDIL